MMSDVVKVQPQPLNCANCGGQFSGNPKEPWCSDECTDELKWKQKLFEECKDYYPFAWSRYTEKDRKDIQHLQWLRDRFVNFHQESENVDFVRRFDNIIDRLRNEWIMTP